MLQVSAIINFHLIIIIYFLKNNFLKGLYGKFFRIPNCSIFNYNKSKQIYYYYYWIYYYYYYFFIVWPLARCMWGAPPDRTFLGENYNFYFPILFIFGFLCLCTLKIHNLRNRNSYKFLDHFRGFFNILIFLWILIQKENNFLFRGILLTFLGIRKNLLGKVFWSGSYRDRNSILIYYYFS